MEREEQQRLVVEGFPRVVNAAATLAARMRSREGNSIACFSSGSSPSLHLQQQANAASKPSPIRFPSPCRSPRVSSPSSATCPLILQEKQGSRKRKSPYLSIGMFQSPLSRMILSPRLQMHISSPSSSHLTRTSSASITGGRQGLAEIDLNVPICSATALNAVLEQQENQAIGCSHDQSAIDLNADPEEQENAVIGFSHDQNSIDLNADPEEQQGDDVSDAAPPPQSSGRRKEVPDHIRKAISEALLARATRTYDLKIHDTREVSETFSVCMRTVQRIWDDTKDCLNRGVPVDVSSKKWKRGRKKMLLDVATLKDVPISNRTTLEDLSTHFGVSKSKIQSMKKEGVIKRVSNTLKPYLTEQNKRERLRWCYSMLDPRTIPFDPLFKGMFDYVFIDEKWFNITRKNLRYYIVPGEEQPERTCKSANHIPKLMILTAVARPRFDSQGNCTFDGKIGCFPFVTYQAAQRSSGNRLAGTIEMKAMDSITKDVIREFMTHKVLPAIRAKWPQEDVNKPIYIFSKTMLDHIFLLVTGCSVTRLRKMSSILDLYASHLTHRT